LSDRNSMCAIPPFWSVAGAVVGCRRSRAAWPDGRRVLDHQRSTGPSPRVLTLDGPIGCFTQGRSTQTDPRESVALRDQPTQIAQSGTRARATCQTVVRDVASPRRRIASRHRHHNGTCRQHAQRDRQRQHHCRTGPCGMTRPTRCAAACEMCHAPHEGQNPRRLQPNAGSLRWLHPPRRSLRKSCARMWQWRWASNSSLLNRGSSAPVLASAGPDQSASTRLRPSALAR
jgi:hypothetical protein